MLIYNTLIKSQLQYGILLWGRTFQSYLKPTYILQKKSLKCCLALRPRTSSNEVFKMANSLTLSNLYTMQLAILIYKYFYAKTLLPPFFLNLFLSTSNLHTHVTRSHSTLELFKFHCSTQTRSHTLKITAPDIWNNLPHDIKSLPSLSIFKPALRKLLLKTL